MHQSMHKKEKSKTKQVLATLKHQRHTFWWLAAENNSLWTKYPDNTGTAAVGH